MSSMRTTRALFERLNIVLPVVGAAVLLTACSADVTRFDFPAFGLKTTDNADGTTASLPPPPKPIYQYQPPKPSQNTYGTAAQPSPYGDNGTRSALGREGVDTTALPAPTAQPRRAPRRANAPAYRPAAKPRQTPKFDDVTATRVTVQPGDTLYAISRRTRTAVGIIRQANGLRGNSIRAGQVLVIPRRGAKTLAPRREPRAAAAPAFRPPDTARRAQTAGRYRVQPGDSLYAISRKTGATVAELTSANNITDPSRLRVGQILAVPGGVGDVAQTSDADADVDQRIAQAKRRSAAKPRRVASLGDEAAGYGVPQAAPLDGQGAGKGIFRWPARGRVISKFGPRANGSHNDGINLAVPEGSSVKAVETGTVAYAGSELKGYGNLVLIRHDNDWVSAYAHNSKLLVKRGDRIKRGQVIAKAGRTGSVDRPQVHFELRKGSKPVDPVKYLARR